MIDKLMLFFSVIQGKPNAISQTTDSTLKAEAKIKPFSLQQFDSSIGFSFVPRIFFIHLTYTMMALKENIIQKGIQLTISHIPTQQSSEMVDDKHIILDEVLSIITMGKTVKGKHILLMILRVFKRDIFLSHLLIVLGIFLKQAQSVVIQNIIASYLSDTPTTSILWALLLATIGFAITCIQGHTMETIKSLTTKIRMYMVIFLYTRAARLTQFQMQQQNVGKLFNMITYDLNTIEQMVYYLSVVCYVPLTFIVAGIILYLRLGIYGLIAIFIVVLVIPAQLFLGMKSRKFSKLKNQHSSERIKLVSESIEGVRLLKMYGWEKAFSKFVGEARQAEQAAIMGLLFNRSLDRSISSCLPVIAGFIVLLIIHFEGSQKLNTAVIFATLAQLSHLQDSMFFTGIGINFLFELNLILARFAEFAGIRPAKIIQLSSHHHSQDGFHSHKEDGPVSQTNLIQDKTNCIKNSLDFQETFIDHLEYPVDSQNAVELTSFSAFWDKQKPPVLKDITLNIKIGHHYGIIGKIGSGKSSFLSALIEEIPFFSGQFKKRGSVAYVEQEPYVFPGKFIDNITFGKPFDESYYSQVIRACCLEEDIAQLPNKDETEVGERGITLSGGQKARLSLARAVYSRNDIFLFDDPLSAVDSKVANQIYHELLKGLLKNKTVVLVTHLIHFTRSCSQIFILDEGIVKKQGTFNELQTSLVELIATDRKENNNGNDEEKIEVEGTHKHKLANVLDISVLSESKSKSTAQKLFTSEADEQIEVTAKSYLRYFGQVQSSLLMYLVITMYIVSQVSLTGNYYILGSYETVPSNQQNTLLITAGICLLVYVAASVCKYQMTIAFIGAANQALHANLFDSLMRAPSSYFDRTPTGRLLVKFSNDIGTADMMMSFLLFDAIEGLISLINIILTVGILNYLVIPLFGVAVLSQLKFLSLFKDTLVVTKKLDLIHRSPFYSQFQRTIQGIVHVRVYEQINNFFQTMFLKTNESMRTTLCFWRINRAFFFNLRCISIIPMLIGVFLCIVQGSSKAHFGQSVIYLMSLLEVIGQLFQAVPSLDINMTQIERIIEVCRIQPEAELTLKGDERLTSNQAINLVKSNQNCVIDINQGKWIRRGEIHLKNVQLRYRIGLDFSLRGVNLIIGAGERVGCVGRTGAGKSSIMNAILRMVEIENDGQIIIDGIDLKTIGLHTLRQSISVIPQSPFVFIGTIKRNLDPLEEFTDEEIWNAIETTNLTDIVKKLPEQLLTDMSNVQSVFSTGQKQLVCLARAVLKNSKVLILDEATANVDLRTDEFIQQTIKKVFPTSTIITIAHRLNTIADFDKVFVLSQGLVTEFSSPYQLLVDRIGDKEITSKSIFAEMVQNTGKKNAKAIFEIAQTTFYSRNQQTK